MKVIISILQRDLTRSVFREGMTQCSPKYAPSKVLHCRSQVITFISLIQFLKGHCAMALLLGRQYCMNTTKTT